MALRQRMWREPFTEKANFKSQNPRIMLDKGLREHIQKSRDTHNYRKYVCN